MRPRLPTARRPPRRDPRVLVCAHRLALPQEGQARRRGRQHGQHGRSAFRRVRDAPEAARPVVEPLLVLRGPGAGRQTRMGRAVPQRFHGRWRAAVPLRPPLYVAGQQRCSPLGRTPLRPRIQPRGEPSGLHRGHGRGMAQLGELEGALPVASLHRRPTPFSFPTRVPPPPSHTRPDLPVHVSCPPYDAARVRSTTNTRSTTRHPSTVCCANSTPRSW